MIRPILASTTRALGLALALLLVARSVAAQSSEGSKAAAEALFNDAVKLMEQGDFAAACTKFQASQKLDPALGTVMRLADCFDRTGKTASAWAMFKEAASTAGNRNQVERERMANERAAELEQRLSRLELRVGSDAPPGLELKLNGILVPPESYNAALPVDPGTQTIEASATGYKPWTGSVEVAAGPSEQAFNVPPLERAPPPSAAAPVAADRPRSSPGATQRTLGFIGGGVGLAALAASGILSYRANDLKEESLLHCRRGTRNACTPEGVALRSDALDYARAATYPFAAGAVLLTAGAILVLTAPSARTEKSRTPEVSAVVSPWDTRLQVESRW